MKKFKITNSQGVVAEFPAHLVANSRAHYYASVDFNQEADPDGWKGGFQHEFDYTLSDDDELLDWAANNMNWEDVADEAVIVHTPEIERDMADAWGEFEIVSE